MRTLDRLLDALPDAVAFYDDDRRYLRVNAAARKLFGRTQTEMRGLRMDDVVAPTAPLDAKWREFMERGTLEGMTPVHQANGNVLLVAYRAQANVVPGIHVTVMREQGTPALEDASLLGQLLALQQETLAPDVRLETIMRSICSCAMRLTGADGATIEMRDGDTMVYRAAGGSLAAYEGLRISIEGSLAGIAVTTGEPQMCTDSEVDPRVNREACRRTGARSMIVVPLEHTQRLVGVLKVVAPRAESFETEDLERLRLTAGLLAAAMVSAEAAELRRELARSEAARVTELERLRDEMTSLVVHDLKSPLTVIMTNIDFLRSELGDENSVALEAVLDAFEATRRLDTLIKTMLETARLESHRLPIGRSRIAMRTLANDVVAARARTVTSRSIAFEVDVPEDLVLHADAILLRRVLDNIVDNALRFVPTRGIVRLAGERAEGRTVIRVANTGPALPVEMRERVFDKFAQVEREARSNFGLGLYFCRLAIEAHGGRVWVESTPEFPAVFAIEL